MLKPAGSLAALRPHGVYTAFGLCDANNRVRRCQEELRLLKKEMQQYESYFSGRLADINAAVSLCGFVGHDELSACRAGLNLVSCADCTEGICRASQCAEDGRDRVASQVSPQPPSTAHAGAAELPEHAQQQHRRHPPCRRIHSACSSRCYLRPVVFWVLAVQQP